MAPTIQTYYSNLLNSRVVEVTGISSVGVKSVDRRSTIGVGRLLEPISDAKAQRGGAETGLDARVVHAVSDGYPAVGGIDPLQ